MKISCAWLAEWVSVPWEPRELGSRLTMAGFELESIEPAAPAFAGVVVGEIVATARHPQADKLQVCRVATGKGEPLQIVCGAANARPGLKSPLAQVGAVLPGDVRIKAAKLRGTESSGMLCSAKELGLAESSSGILELPSDAPVGADLREYLALDDTVLELNVTPNRGDALSVLGIAREVAALAGATLGGPPLQEVPARDDSTFPVSLDAPAACPRFAGRVIRGVDARAATPLWMRERLRRAGLRSISPVVDVTNYVLLELGQPMHAYDLRKLQGEIRVRMAAAGERITLLDGQSIALEPDMLVIADRAGPVGLAGIMGGERTAVSAATTDVFLEVAYFAPEAIAGRSRRLALQTDAGQRFERGVDPCGQQRALERATELLLQIAGGTPGPATLARSREHEPQRPPVKLRASRLQRLLGMPVEAQRVESVLQALGMRIEREEEGWQVTPPPHRFDITIEADLIEEVARIVGFEAIPETHSLAPQRFRSTPEAQPLEQSALETVAARGYQEVINFAFVDPGLQQQLFPESQGLALANPITSDLAVMRASLWPGLVRAALENQRRQQERVRLFEHGARFLVADGATREIDTIAAIACGTRLPEQWGAGREPLDFYDVKADVQALLATTGDEASFAFEPGTLPCLHAGRAARIVRDGAPVGWLGELHPRLVRELEFVAAPVLFELDFAAALRVRIPAYKEISRYPQVRRDLAVVVDESVSFGALRERVTLSASSLLRDLRIFDVYRGPGVEAGRKSVALGLIFQDISRTLTDEDIDRAVAAVVADLRASLDAKIRE